MMYRSIYKVLKRVLLNRVGIFYFNLIPPPPTPTPTPSLSACAFLLYSLVQLILIDSDNEMNGKCSKVVFLLLLCFYSHVKKFKNFPPNFARREFNHINDKNSRKKFFFIFKWQVAAL